MLKFKANEYKFVRTHSSLRKESENISGDWMNSREWRPQESPCIRTNWQKAQAFRAQRQVTRLQISGPGAYQGSIRDSLLGPVVFRTRGTARHHPAGNSLLSSASVTTSEEKCSLFPLLPSTNLLYFSLL